MSAPPDRDRRSYPAPGYLDPMSSRITLMCGECHARGVTISEIAWATCVQGRTPPRDLLTCDECRKYPYSVRLRWRTMDQDPLQGVYE